MTEKKHSEQDEDAEAARTNARLHAAATLSTDLHNFLHCPGDTPRQYLLDVLDTIVAREIEGREADYLGRRLAVLAWDAVRTEAKSPRFGTGEKRLRFIVETARNLRLMYFVPPKAMGVVFRTTSADADPKVDTFANSDAKIDRIVGEIAIIVGLRAAEPVNAGGEDRRRRRLESPKTRAMRVYNILAEASESSARPDSNVGRASAGRKLIEETSTSPPSVVP